MAEPREKDNMGKMAGDLNWLKEAGGIVNAKGVLNVEKKPIPLSVHFARMADMKRTDFPYNNGRITTAETREGAEGVSFLPGDAIMTGTRGECWPIEREKFEKTYSPVPGAAHGTDGSFFKSAGPVLAVQLAVPFSISASWGELSGKPGDWLVQYDDAGKSFGIVDRGIFQETYNKLGTTEPQLPRCR